MEVSLLSKSLFWSWGDKIGHLKQLDYNYIITTMQIIYHMNRAPFWRCPWHTQSSWSPGLVSASLLLSVELCLPDSDVGCPTVHLSCTCFLLHKITFFSFIDNTIVDSYSTILLSHKTRQMLKMVMAIFLKTHL